MNITSNRRPPHDNTAEADLDLHLSIPLAALAGGLLSAGVVSGGWSFLHRSPIRAEHIPGTAAWWPHLVLSALAAGLLLRAERRRTFSRSAVLLAPLNRRAAHRLRYTATAALRRPMVLLRLFAAIPLLALLLFIPYRIGMQVLGGLDPNFVVDAWGGPSYLGAMACHYLDGALMITGAAWLLGRLLLRAHE